jgi:magnesium transporter
VAFAADPEGLRMDIETRIAGDLLRAHPIDAAQALEQLPAREVAALLQKLESEIAGGILQRMAPALVGGILLELGEEKATEIVERLPVEMAALSLRSMEPSVRDRILAALPAPRSRALASQLRFPDGTAGSLMDPEVLALPHDLTAREALARVREAAGKARCNLYIVDRDQTLIGVINLQELLVARPADRLSSLMQTGVHRLSARADRHAIVSDPGWREVHALPVVDDQGIYLGAIGYQTLRLLEEQLRGSPAEEGATARALGGLLRAGAAAVLEAMVASTPQSQTATELRRSRDGA